MKTTMKQLAAVTFIALILLVGNVSAKGTEAKASGHENIETTLHLEKWMTSETVWNTNSINVTEFVLETEAGLGIANWMTNEETWNLNSNFDQETELGMELESWMTNDKMWDVNDFNSETALIVENWMINNNVWK